MPMQGVPAKVRLADSEIVEFRDWAGWAQRWLFGEALPVWLDRGTDWRHGAFYDSLAPLTLENASDFKRLRVLARQIYVFSHAARLDCPGAKDAVIHGLSFLLGPASLAGGGYATRFALDGRILEAELDFYDLAFVLFALAHAYDLLRDPRLREEAQSLLGLLRTRMRHTAGGFFESIPARLPRRQNPHMHLLEACLAWLEVDGDEGFAEVADEMVSLFSSRFFQRDEGVLLEFFDDDLQPARALEPVCEPGHHFEWVWLLQQYAVLRGARQLPVKALFDFAVRHGIDRRTGFLFGEISPKGDVLMPACRLWPHTEWLKAELVSLGKASACGVPMVMRQIRGFLTTATPGLWHERWDPGADAFIGGACPASTLYHIVFAFAELTRVSDSLVVHTSPESRG